LNDKRNDERVERFFQHNPLEDPLYLKKYVKDHPDHKMAWYLLGREYAAKGKHAKATYCFAQAGEIYEAFENQKVVVEKDDLEKALHANIMPISMRKRVRAKWKWGVLAALLLFIYIPASFDMTRNKSQAPERAVETLLSSTEVRGVGAMVNEAVSQPPVEKGTKIYYSEGSWNQDLGKLIVPKDRKWTSSLLVEGNKTPDHKWIEWYMSPKILLGVEMNEANKGQSQIQYYDPNLCDCETVDNSTVVSIVHNWMQEREEAIVLSSAISAYKQKNGALPQKAEQLYRSYPHNLLPGLTPQMQAMFPKILKETTTGQLSNSASPDTSQPASSTDGAEQPNKHQDPAMNPAIDEEPLIAPLQEPLEILVDKDKHRLALVSGNFVIRSFPVGLGGDKTPEGSFIISEKVRNPNGRSNGEFGSRGMTLSDTLYAIHGTNKPASIGKNESLGCVRMLQEDLEELYDMVPQQTKVTIGKGVIPPSGAGEGTGKPAKRFKAPLQTEDSNPKKTYKWLD
jgi:lipoprotein-anchoring transpeptidase ErfK/SrfK